MENLPKIRWQTKKNIKESQKIQKKYHNQKIKIKQKFNIGNQVLLYNAAKEKQ
jgi:hypothetical protein